MKNGCWLVLALLLASCRTETEPASCEGETCSGHGTCAVVGEGAVCTCEAGFAGADCSACADGHGRAPDGGCIPDGPCAQSPGHCGAHGVCDDRGGALSCVCDPGWAGATCADCAEGYAAASPDVCQRVETTCTTESCSGHGWCAEDTGTVVCTCSQGYEGAFCDRCAAGHHLSDSGTCDEDQFCADFDPCGDHGTCSDDGGIVRCACDVGWAGEICADCAVGYHPDATLGCALDEVCPVADPCLPNGTCDDSTGVVACQCTSPYEGPTCNELAPCASDADCSGGSACVAYACVFPVPDPAAYATEAANRRASYVWSIQYPALYPVSEDCCFDYDGDGSPDDGLGSLLSLLVGLPGLGVDPQALMDAEIDAASLVRILDWTQLPDPLADGQVHLSVFDGVLVDPGTGLPDLAARRAGLAGVLLEPSSFGTHGALSQLNDGRLTASVLTARGNTLQLPVPFFGIVQEMSFQDVRVQGPLELGAASDPCRGLCSVDEVRGSAPDTYEAAGLQVGGTLSITELVTALDDFYRACACRGLDPSQPVLGVSPDSVAETMEVTCTNNIGVPDACLSGDPCEALDTFCSVSSVLGGILDVDRDTDGIKDALSAGYRFGISGTTVEGLAP